MDARNMSSYLSNQAQGLTHAQVAVAGFETSVVAPSRPIIEEDDIPDPDDETLWETLDPDTKRRFNIPFLSISDPLYRATYINLMRQRHRDLAKFNRMVLLRDGK